jgi:N-acetylglucosamine-6-phosphate deacetylase
MLYREGVTTYFPTVITNSDEAIAEALRSIVRARAEDSLIERVVAGIHLEGPFISPEDGPRGAHDSDYVRAPDWSLFQGWQEVAEGAIRILTLSPEWPEAPEFIATCVESGVTVAIGHTAATPEQIREAVAAGALMSTHLGNGAHPVLPRHPNYIWEQLAQDNLWACVIADGFHLPNSVLKVVLRTKAERAILVSDAVALGGMEPGEYDAPIGSKVVLAPEGKLYLAETPELLAGSVKTLREGIEHLVLSQLSNLPEAWEMASTRPATLLHLPTRAGLSVGATADLVVFRYTRGRIDVIRTYKEGRMVHPSASERATEEELQ